MSRATPGLSREFLVVGYASRMPWLTDACSQCQINMCYRRRNDVLKRNAAFFGITLAIYAVSILEQRRLRCTTASGFQLTTAERLLPFLPSVRL